LPYRMDRSRLGAGHSTPVPRHICKLMVIKVAAAISVLIVAAGAVLLLES
jgi:hypothetical protein